MRILLIEDDAELRANLAKQLERAHYATDTAEDGEVGAYMAETGSYSAIVLDIGLPMIDGLSLLEGLRAKGNQTPVLLLTARDGWKNKVRGLRLGADDYMTKPFQSEELFARLEALIRRANGHSDGVITVGNLALDLGSKSLLEFGQPVHLTANEYRALAALFVKRGTVLSKTELAEQIWQEELDRDLNAVEVTIARLRKKLSEQIIQTCRGHGYIVE